MLMGVAKVADLAQICDDIVRDSNARLDDELGELGIDWEFYKTLEQRGMILLITAERTNTVAGFGLYMMMNHPHHPKVKLGLCSMLNVRVAYRGKGVGRMIIEHAMLALRQIGCSHIQHGHREVYGKEPLFPKLGFVELDRFYIKELN